MDSALKTYVIQTSGSTGVAKRVVHSADSLHAAADMACEAFGLNSTDRFLQTLPHEHISGLMLHVRAQVCGGELVRFVGAGRRWNAQECLNVLKREEITRCSLVPAQLFDFVTLGTSAPRSLVTAWLGGDHLRSDLKARAIALGWPIVETFGMTETAGMIAVRNDGEGFSCLPGVEIRESAAVTGRLEIRAPQLFSGYLEGEAIVGGPTRGGFWESEDTCEILENGDFRVLARATEKIAGRKVSLPKLREIWESCSSGLGVRSELRLMADDRLGASVELRVSAVNSPVDQAVSAFNAQVAPYERIRSVEVDTEIGLRKVNR